MEYKGYLIESASFKIKNFYIVYNSLGGSFTIKGTIRDVKKAINERIAKMNSKKS